MSQAELTEEQKSFIAQIETTVKEQVASSLKKYGTDTQALHDEFRKTYQANLEKLAESDKQQDARITKLESQIADYVKREAPKMVQGITFGPWDKVVPEANRPGFQLLLGTLPSQLEGKTTYEAQKTMYVSSDVIAGMLNTTGKPAKVYHLKRRSVWAIGGGLILTGAIAGAIGRGVRDKRRGRYTGYDAPPRQLSSDSSASSETSSTADSSVPVG